VGIAAAAQGRSWPDSADFAIAPKSAAIWGTPDVLPTWSQWQPLADAVEEVALPRGQEANLHEISASQS